MRAKIRARVRDRVSLIFAFNLHRNAVAARCMPQKVEEIGMMVVLCHPDDLVDAGIMQI